MNEFNIKVDIKNNKLLAPIIELVQNDYNSTKLKFDFTDDADYTKAFQLQLPDGSMWIKDIINNEIILADEKDGQIVPILVQNGQYKFDVAVYSNNAKLTTTNQESFHVRSEMAGQDVELDDRLPILDDLINKTRNAVNEAENLDIDIINEEDATIVEITKKDGTKKEAVVSGGSGGIDDYNLLRNKPSINGNELNGNKSLDDLGIQPKGNYLESEKDPTVPSHVKSIKETDISKWNSKSDFSGSYNDLDDMPSNLAKTDQNNNFTASQTINGTLTINGDIVQNGEQYETHAEKVYTKNDEIITREGAIGGLADGEYSGIQAQNYDGQNNGRLGFNSEGEARVGDIGDEQPLLTRDEVENLTDGQLLKWDGKQLKAVGTDEYQKKAELEEKALIITYEDGTTETVKLVVHK